MPLQPGEIVDRYVIESLLGAGGMGEVYRARDQRLQRSVALKVLHEVPADGSGASGSNPSTGGAERLLREARAAAALEHANVVAIYDVGQVATTSNPEGVTYLAMELIKGASLRSYVGTASVPVSERLRWLSDVARALGAAHRAGVVHRDVKPENVMIREDGTVKVLDFGIARRTSAMVDPTSSTAGQSLATMTARGVVVGTPQYMAPEQLRADPLDGRADQFAWGVVAYELLTGKPPWRLEEGAIALVAQILSHEPPPIGTLADVPEHVARSLTRALMKDRGARFPTMEVLVDALAGKVDAFAVTAASLPPRATPPPPPSKEVQAFASAPTEAIMTPPTSRGPSGPTPPARPSSERRRRIIAPVAMAIAMAAAVGVGMKLRARSAANDPSHPQHDAQPAECSNQACMDAHGGEPWICRATDHQCVSLASTDCTVNADPGDVAAPSTVWLGAMIAQSGASAEESTRTVELARRDFAETLGKLENVRHVAFIACDARADYRRVARHLAEDVQVPAAIVGLTNASDLIEVISKVFAPRGVLALLPVSVSPQVTSLPQGSSGRLVYRSTYSSGSLLAPTAAFVESVLEPRLSPPASNRTLRVAFLHNKAISARVFYDRLLTLLRFNGKSVTDNGDDFHDVAYEDDADSYAATVRELQRFRPDIVLARVSAAAMHGVIDPLEKHWSGATPKPTYVLSMSLTPDMSELVASDPSWRRRFFGMDTVSNTPANAQFVNHFNQTFNAAVTRVESPGTFYDAAYSLEYASYALDGAPASGPAIAQNFRRLAGPGKEVLVGPQPIFDAYRELVAGANIDLEGTSGHLDLDPTTGESTFPISILCVEPRLHGATAGPRESGLVYDASSRAFVGALACP